MAAVITLMVVALAAGYIGARIERRRSSSITKREATELRRDLDEMRVIFNEHWDVHKILKHQVESLGQNMAVIGEAVGMDRPHSLH
jgi:hypothetical protein